MNECISMWSLIFQDRAHLRRRNVSPALSPSLPTRGEWKRSEAPAGVDDGSNWT